jgi:hypothetical protein
MQMGSPELLANIARYAILTFAVIAAVNQLGIAPTVVNTLLIGTVGAVALAFGLAFGLGGRDVAARIAEGWYTSGQQAAQRMQMAAARPATTTQAAPQPTTGTSTIPEDPQRPL